MQITTASSLVLLFLCYPTVIRKSVEIFNCIYVAPAELDKRTGEEIAPAVALLMVDTNVDCTSIEYATVRMVALGTTFFFGFGIPYGIYRYIKPYSNRLGEDDTKLKFGFIYLGYHDEVWWWECVVLLRKLAISFVLIFFKTRLYVQIFLALFLVQASLCAHLYFTPFVNPSYNFFETVALTAVSVTLQASYFYLEPRMSNTMNLSIHERRRLVRHTLDDFTERYAVKTK